LFEQVLIQAGIVWLVRSLYFHASIFAAALDFGLVSVGLAASAWAMVNTDSLAGALWSFFLVQALFCWVPQLARQQSSGIKNSQQDQSSFQSAHRVALDAVRKLTQP
jgi:cyanate permease